MHHTLDSRLLWRLVRRPLWLTCQVASVAGVAFQALALALGALAAVQPVLVNGLLMSVPLQASLDRRRPSRRDLAAVALATAGLAAFLTTARPQGGIAQPSGPAWTWTGIAAGPSWPAACCSADAPQAPGGPPGSAWPPASCTGRARRC